MKIKLAILENDQVYLNRIVSAFGTKYSDKLEMYSFTDLEVALSTLRSVRIDVLIASDLFEIDFSKIPTKCGFAYFVDSADVETLNDKPAICKFQKAELIYKQILNIYSEIAGNVSGLKLNDESTKVIAFEPISGGCGSSSMAAACAIHFAAKGAKVLYLNLEKFGATDIIFKAEGPLDMSDVIFALKSKKANLAIKIESCVKKDESGVYFFSPTKVALDMFELKSDDIIDLITEITTTGNYEYLILDMDFSVDKEMLKVLKLAHSVVWVGDGSEISNTKLFKTINALSMLEQNGNETILDRLALIYNKFSNKTSQTLNEIRIKNIGGSPRYEHATAKQVVDQLSVMGMFDGII